MTDDAAAAAAADVTDQPTLAGLDLPAVQVPAPADALPRLAVVGTLAHRIEVHSTADGHVIIDALIQQHLAHHPRAVPLLARHRQADLGSFALTHCAATELATRLNAAHEVLAVGCGLEPARHRGEEVMRLIHCDSLSLPPTGETP